MRTLPSHITVGLINYIYGKIHNPCERRGYAFMVLPKYSIIFRCVVNNYW